MDGGNVRVAVRVRPLCARERLAGSTEVISICSDGKTILAAPDRHFTFDSVFPTNTEQADVFQELASPLLDSFVDGYNGTVLAYGQTGSGKTYTMGTGLEGLDDMTVGIIPRAVQYLIDRLDKFFPTESNQGQQEEFFEIYVSFLELYNEEIIDLLNPSSQDRLDRTKKPVLTIREDPANGICIAGIKEEKARTGYDILECLQKGTLGRTTKSTDMNLVSSRSHAVFTLTLRQRRRICDEEGIPCLKSLISKLHFVDLAGSERLKRTGVVGERAKESISINSGLLALGNVISALGDESKKATHVPYRDSKLTRLLQDSLGGNSRTVMIACISPSSDNYAETVNTLKYANRARNIKNNIALNEDSAGNAAFEIMQLKKLVSALKTEILQLRGLGVSRRSIIAACTPRKGSLTPDSEELSRLRNHNRDLQRRFDQLLKDKITIEAERDFFKGAASPSTTATSVGVDRQVNVLKEHLKTIADLRAKVNDLEQAARPNQVMPRRKTIGNTGPLRHVSGKLVSTPSSPGNLEAPSWFNKASDLIDRTRQELQNNERTMTELRHNAMDDLLNEKDETVQRGEAIPVGVGREAFAAAVMARTEVMMGQVQNDQRLKEELIVQLETSQQEYLVMRRKYEERLRLLQENIGSIQRERDQAIKAVAPREDTRVARIRYEEKIKRLGREVNELKEKLVESHRDAGSKSSSNDILVRNLRSTLQTVKTEKIRLQGKVDELGTRLQQQSGGQDSELKEIRAKERKASEQARKYKKAYEFQKALLQKRIEQHMHTKNRVRNLLNALRRHRIPLSPSVGSLLDSPNWRRTEVGSASSLGRHPETPCPVNGSLSRGGSSSGLGSKSVSAADLRQIDVDRLSIVEEGGGGAVGTEVESPVLQKPEMFVKTPTKERLNRSPHRHSIPSGQPTMGPLATLPPSILRMSPLISRRADPFSKIADSVSYSLAAAQLSSWSARSTSSPASRTPSRKNSQEPTLGGDEESISSPMKIDGPMSREGGLSQDILDFYAKAQYT